MGMTAQGEVERVKCGTLRWSGCVTGMNEDGFVNV